MSTGRKVKRDEEISEAVVRSLHEAFGAANSQAAALVRAYRGNWRVLMALQEEIERGADRANAIASRAQTTIDKKVG